MKPILDAGTTYYLSRREGDALVSGIRAGVLGEPSALHDEGPGGVLVRFSSIEDALQTERYLSDHMT